MSSFFAAPAKIATLSGLLLCLLPPAVWVWNAVGAPRLGPAYVTDGLNGVTVPDPPVQASPATIWTGLYQRQVEKQAGASLPVFADVVRFRNQLLYSVFGISSSRRLIIGKDGVLYEKIYVDEYCHRDLASFVPAATAWVDRLRQIQDYYDRLGKTFLYLITPSKAASYPEWLPKHSYCPASLADRIGRMPAYRRILDRAGIRYVDATALVEQYRAAYPVPLFPRGGTHWGQIAVAKTVQSVVALLASRKPDWEPMRFDLGIGYTDSPTGTDIDLASLLNLAFPDFRYKVSVVTPQPVPSTGTCRPPRIAEIGGSFVWKLNDVLNRLPCVPKIDFFYYYSHAFADYPDLQPRIVWSVDAAAQRGKLADADVVLLEENEESLPQSYQGSKLYESLIVARKIP